MGITIKNTKDCKDCIHAEVYGSIEDPCINCMSTDSTNYTNFERDGRFCATYCKGYKKSNNINRQGNIDIKIALNYMLAGKSEFILHSTKTNQDFLYKLTKKESLGSKEDDKKYIYFLNVKLSNNYLYAGVIWFDTNENIFKFSKGKNGNLDANDINIRSLLFIMNKLYTNDVPETCLIFHTGTCGRCGKKLTTPESILTGLGPSCAKYCNIPRVKIRW